MSAATNKGRAAVRAATEVSAPDVRRSLLIVDDEPQICRSLQRILRGDGYRIFTAGGAAEAFAILDEHAVDVIVSDQRMPQMKGTEFLNEVMSRYPRTVRMILSGAADLEDITTAMRDGAIYKFLTKPIDPSLLRANVAEAFSRVETLAAERADGEQRDASTGLLTREGVERVYRELASREDETGTAFCVMLIQVDQYSNVVASFGYSFGEEFVRVVADALKPHGESDCHVCRDAPDTFLLLSTGPDTERLIIELKDRLDRAFAGPLLVSGRSITVTISLGATSSTDASLELTELVDQARTAMMTARMRGGATMQIYREDLVSAWRDRVELESDLRQAVASEAFELHYQPQIDITTGRIAGLEALLRWPHPDHGFVSPAQFVPIAESLGLIKKLGLWVLETAVRQFVEWDRRSLAPRELAVNVSAFQLRTTELVPKLRELLDRSGLEPKRLVLEITETAAIEQEAVIAECLEGLRSLGVTLAIDDFGTGYANLSLLSKLDINKLKLDRSLLPVGREERSAKVFANVVTMARELGLDTVAEGVETPAELAAVYKAGCRAVQGYFYSPPMDTDKVGALLEKQTDETGGGEDAILG